MTSIKDVVSGSGKLNNHPLFKVGGPQTKAPERKTNSAEKGIHLLNTKSETNVKPVSIPSNILSERGVEIRSKNHGELFSSRLEKGQFLRKEQSPPLKTAPVTHHSSIFNFSRTSSSMEASAGPALLGRTLSAFKPKIKPFMLSASVLKKFREETKIDSNRETNGESLQTILNEFPKTERNIFNEKIMKVSIYLMILFFIMRHIG